MGLRFLGVLSFAACAALPIVAGGCGINGSIRFVITTGSDDLRWDTFAGATLHYEDGHVQNVTLKGGGDNGWGSGSITTKDFDLDEPGAISYVDITIDEHAQLYILEGSDRWDIKNVNIYTTPSGGGQSCVADGQGGTLDDHTRSIRIDAGCSGTTPGGPTTGETGSPTGAVDFVFETGSDDLRYDSELNATILFQDATQQTVPLKAATKDLAWDAGSTRTVHADIYDTSPIAELTLTLTSHDGTFENNDTWNVSNVTLNASEGSRPERCVISGPKSGSANVTDNVPLVLPAGGCPLGTPLISGEKRFVVGK
jgi:hypothetical protein